MVTLNLFIESSLQIHCIRYLSEGTSLLITCPQLTEESSPLLAGCCNTVATGSCYVILPDRVNTKVLQLVAYANVIGVISGFIYSNRNTTSYGIKGCGYSKWELYLIFLNLVLLLVALPCSNCFFKIFTLPYEIHQ